MWQFLGALRAHITPLPLCHSLHSAAWKVNVMTGALAAILDPKNKVSILGKVGPGAGRSQRL